jgi:hypothetical protein
MLHVAGVINFVFLLHACTPATPDALSFSDRLTFFVEATYKSTRDSVPYLRRGTTYCCPVSKLFDWELTVRSG